MEIWTAPTPNGWKVNIMVEELAEAGISLPKITMRSIDITAGEQFSAEFTRHNPNQKIPVLIDDDLSIMESCAILQYLGEKFPSALLPSGKARWDVLQWLYWQAANVGPAFGNKLSYTRYMPEVPDVAKAHPLERFGKESRRLASVLNKRLEGRDYVCGSTFTIADIAIYPWLRGWKWSKVNIADLQNVLAWVDRVRARPAVGRGLAFEMPESEIDRWSEERKSSYAQGGASLASNDKLRTEG